MKPASSTTRGQNLPDRRSGTYAQGARQNSDPRIRVLLFACESDDAQLMMIYSERMEITYLPSYDMTEVREKIERCKPKLILCEANAFLDAFPASAVEGSTRSKRDNTSTMATDGSSPISRREFKILSMLAKGQTNDEIAKALRLSSRTVKRTLSSLFERLQVTNRTELASRISELSILENDN